MTLFAIASTSNLSGQISLKNTYFPSFDVPNGSVSKSILILPAKAYATTKGGEAK